MLLVFDERFTSALDAGKFGDAAIQSAAGVLQILSAGADDVKK
jgi:hypothetical protein